MGDDCTVICRGVLLSACMYAYALCDNALCDCDRPVYYCGALISGSEFQQCHTELVCVPIHPYNC